MFVGLLTIEQRDKLVNQYLDKNQVFNPVLDAFGEWVISKDQIDKCKNPKFKWVKDLSIIRWMSPEV